MSQMLTGTSWSRVRDIVKSRDKETCQYCGQLASEGEVDHILPLSKGGHDGLDNLVWACPKCNKEKKDRTLRDWVKEMLARKPLMELPVFTRQIDKEAPGWECDCGGYAYDKEVVVLHNHGHHKPDCPILRYLGTVYYSPACSKIVEGEWILGCRIIEPGSPEYCEYWEEGEALQKAREQLGGIPVL